MKKRYLIVVLFAISASALIAQEEEIDAPVRPYFDPPVGVFSAGFSAGGLTSGEQFTLSQSLSPKPDSVNYLSFIGDIKLFPIENLGLEFSASPGTTFGSSSGLTDLYLFNSATLKFGLDGRFFLVKKPKFGLSLDLGAGGTYSILQYNDAFKNLLLSNAQPGTELYGIKNAFGYYGKVGIEFYMFRFLYAGVFLEYFYQGNTIDNAQQTALDGGYINVPIEIGVYIH